MDVGYTTGSGCSRTEGRTSFPLCFWAYLCEGVMVGADLKAQARKAGKQRPVFFEDGRIDWEIRFW